MSVESPEQVQMIANGQLLEKDVILWYITDNISLQRVELNLLVVRRPEQHASRGKRELLGKRFDRHGLTGAR